jgi:4-hydroxy-tetrahydrodipicolinate reductase
MNIALVGYGKMGKIIEEIAIERGHTIVAKYSSSFPFDLNIATNIDVAIEFSLPKNAINHINCALNNSIPIVVGTTGWNNDLEAVTESTISKNGAVLHASNFSLGVNLFFVLTQQLAKLMNGRNYEATIEEIHHIQKLDSPSGTAITTAQKIFESQDQYTRYVLFDDVDEYKYRTNHHLPIFSERIPDVPGTHHVNYDSHEDRITLTHEAKNRRGFALGAVLAAEWLQHKKGIFTMSDVLQLK